MPRRSRLGGHRLGVRDAGQRPLNQPVEAGQHADDLLRVTFDQVRHRPTIPSAVQTCSLSWFRLRRGRENCTSVPSYERGTGMVTTAHERTRKLTVFAQDPSVRDLEGKIIRAEVTIPAETLD